MQNIDVILTSPLLSKLDEHLLDVLKSLSASDWERKTIVPLWNLKDIAAHLLDGNIRPLSMLRDSYFGEKPGDISSYQDLVVFLNKLNADWVRAMKRVSPQVLIELLEITGREYCEYIASLDPFSQAAFSVAWAGELVSENWFHIAREYTEKWHHQQQIRLAVGQTQILYTKELYYPYLETSMRALPYHYRNMEAPLKSLLRVTILGDSGGTWDLLKQENEWVLLKKSDLNPTCEIKISPQIAWRMFTKGINMKDAEKEVMITGTESLLGAHIFSMLAVMA